MLLGVLGLLAVLTYGFANSNTVDPSNAGDGGAAISGFTVTNVHYDLNASNPSTIDNVSFTLNPALPVGGASRISLDGGTNWLATNACTGATMSRVRQRERPSFRSRTCGLSRRSNERTRSRANWRGQAPARDHQWGTLS